MLRTFIHYYIADLRFQDVIKSGQLSMDERLGKVAEQLASDAQPGHAQDVRPELWL